MEQMFVCFLGIFFFFFVIQVCLFLEMEGIV